MSRLGVLVLALSRSLPFSLALLAVVSLVVFAAAASRAPAERIGCSEPLVDFGPVAGGAELRHRFVFANDSAVDAEKLSVTASCSSCSSAKVDRSRLAAGQRSAVDVLVEVGDTPGPIRREFIVQWRASGDTEMRKAVLAVEATVAK